MSYEPLNEKSPPPLTEKVPVQPMQIGQPATYYDYKQNSDVRRTRTILIVVLGIQLVLSIIYFITTFVDLIKFYRKPASERGSGGGTHISSTIFAAVSVIYIGIYIAMTIHYIRIGILVFAWLGLIQLILVIIVVVMTIVLVVGIAVLASSAAVGIVGSILVIVLAGLLCLLTILSVAFGFRLAKHLKIHQTYQYV